MGSGYPIEQEEQKHHTHQEQEKSQTKTSPRRSDHCHALRVFDTRLGGVRILGMKNVTFCQIKTIICIPIFWLEKEESQTKSLWRQYDHCRSLRVFDTSLGGIIILWMKMSHFVRLEQLCVPYFLARKGGKSDKIIGATI